MVEERREVISEEQVSTPGDLEVVTDSSRVVQQPVQRVVEEPVQRVTQEPGTTYVQRRDPVGSSIAAGSLIQTVVWAIVVLVLLVVGILILVHFKIL